ncbi:tissue factor pathway inhibitor 2-like [Rana temporaria]|uniref:tissue factor pathway inhibitor 2-like n=1 Tax=Rana temporaria TaxID=8407 RepID=UPI001AACE1A7|nr:tissue factor pathway inhibitor 2-like [Rana temporaria]
MSLDEMVEMVDILWRKDYDGDHGPYDTPNLRKVQIMDKVAKSLYHKFQVRRSKEQLRICDNTQSTDQHQLSIVVTKTQDYNMKTTLILAVIAASLMMFQLTSAIPAVCKLPALKGPCKGSFPRYFYNKLTRKCEQFIYGGCEGNENRFLTKDLCKNVCEYAQAEAEVLKFK